MKAIYEPKGRAKEYCDLAVNLYEGCNHGCTYCFAPAVLHKTREQFIQVRPREGILEALEKEAPKYAGREVLLCFTCDPYPEIETELKITRRAIEILHANNITVRILTKAGCISIQDFDLLAKNPNLSWYGVTLTLLGNWMDYEPHADSPHHNLMALRLAYNRGIRTWVSLEPVIDPAQSLELIRPTHVFVDEYKVGKLNHNKGIEDKIDREYGWGRFAQEAIKLLETYGKKYYIKQDLRGYLKGTCENDETTI